MIEKIINRVEELEKTGNNFLSQIEYYKEKPVYWFNEELLPDLQKWVASVITLINFATSSDSYYYQETKRIANSKDTKRNISFNAVQKLTGLISSFKEELAHGFLQNFEFKIISLTFDDFLDHAADFHSANKKIESSILVSIVFEDTIRKLAAKNSVDEEGKSIEDIINDLTKVSVFSGVESKRLKSYATLRNYALHAHWDKFNIKDVGLMIKGTKDLIKSHLDSD